MESGMKLLHSRNLKIVDRDGKSKTICGCQTAERYCY